MNTKYNDYKTIFANMQANQLALQVLQQNKQHCYLDPTTQQACYFEVHSRNFQFKEFNKGTRFQRDAHHINPSIMKYYMKRKFLFSKFQQVKMDEQSWFSVIPEPVSLYLKDRFQSDGFHKIFEPFSGVGGIAVHLCNEFDEYIVNDISPQTVERLKHNMKVYQKNISKVHVYCDDFLNIPSFSTDLLIICPPWGGVDLSAYSYQQLDEIMKPTLTDILKHCKKFSQNILLQMPKNTNLTNLIKVALRCQIFPIFSIQKIQTNGKTSQLFIYFGEEKFTRVRYSAIYNHIYHDLKLTGRKEKMSAKKNMKQKPTKIMKAIYNSKISGNVQNVISSCEQIKH